MKRDKELIRNILLALQSQESAVLREFYPPESVLSSDYTEEQVWEHVALLIEAGLIEGERLPESIKSYNLRITWDGHELIDTISDPKVWAMTKNHLSMVGVHASFEILKTVATALIKDRVLG